MSSTLTLFLASTLYGLPSLILYILTFVVILRHRKTFDSSFFQLYVFDGIMNLFTYIMGFVVIRLASVTCGECVMAPLFRNLGSIIPPSLLKTLQPHMAYVQYSITALVSLNRLTVLINYNVFEPIWKRFTWIFILLAFFAPFLKTYVMLIFKAEISYIEATDSFELVSNDLPFREIFLSVFMFMMITMIISTLCNLLSFRFLRSLSIQRKKAEANFLIIMSITCFVQFVGAVLTGGLLFHESAELLGIILVVLPYSSDLLSLLQPWLLVCFSKAIRKQIKETFGWSSEQHIVQIRSITS
ncbi:Serpentine receptor class gamma [Caenorhabditis elegans]|uniref:Serpentine receptor class gamma n=1 Tax=Caenorhabditis elegans TaxID=6239 RepID=O45426_CAEEL|nr:Serpentine receptor class gamma [Caenorhabditis elegans]CAB07199.2 Serpentine receptor class gamma [Caenorhabditis elegans]|eukprot:NP_507387.2 Serpentine receptor class gamma [Caenorhabditis elegans]